MIMRKILSFLLSLLISITAMADKTISYGQISSFCPQTGQTLGGGAVIAITIGENYIIHPMYGKLFACQRNYDGSITYLPSGFAGTPGMQLNAVLISSDLQRLEERCTSSVGNMSINMINTYTSAGEDGGRYANSWANAQAVANRGGSSSHDSRDSGTCSSCKGTGVNKTPNTGGSRSNWVAYYNSQGNKCPYCGGYTRHFHDKCARCNAPRY
jgi:hypothetical protein